MASRHAPVEQPGGITARALSDLLNKNVSIKNSGAGSSNPFQGGRASSVGASENDARASGSQQVAQKSRRTGQNQRGLGRPESGAASERKISHRHSIDGLKPKERCPKAGSSHNFSSSNPHQNGRSARNQSPPHTSSRQNGGPSNGRPPNGRNANMARGNNRIRSREEDGSARANESGYRNSQANGRERQDEAAKKTVLEVAAAVREWATGRMRSSGFLDLTAMNTDPVLLQKEIWPPGHPKATKNTPMFFWKAISEIDPYIHAISLANNDLDSLRILLTLPDYLPHVTALDLSGNVQIRGWGDLERIRPGHAAADAVGFKHLRQVVLTGTGLAKAEAGSLSYARRPVYLFPNLEKLDNHPIPRATFPMPVGRIGHLTTRSNFEQIKGKPFAFPFSVGGPVVHGDAAAMALINKFAGKFFGAMDKDRESLIYAYHPGATLSFHAVRFDVPRNNMMDKPREQKTHKHGWNAYPQPHKDPSAMSRDLLDFREDKNAATLVIAKDEMAIRNWLKNIPRTSHPVSDGSKWLMDTIEVPIGGTAGIMLIVHGEFEEGKYNVPRSFTRTLLITPAVAGSPSATRGWGCTVVSDTLSIRPRCPTLALHADLTTGGAQIANPGQANGANHTGTLTSPPADPALTDLPPEQQTFVRDFARHSGLIISAARDCAIAGGFNAQTTMQLFESQKATIPAELFSR